MKKTNTDYWVTYDEATDLYSMSKRKLQELAHRANAVKKINKTAYVNLTAFEKFMESFRPEKEVEKMIDKVIPLKKKFIRLKEGAELYSMGVEKFTLLATDARAIYKIDKLVLVNIEILEEYMENYRL